jgi:rare lipoprotein A
VALFNLEEGNANGGKRPTFLGTRGACEDISDSMASFYSTIILPSLFFLAIAPGTRGETASWYGEWHRGRPMANGQPFDPDKFICASRRYPMGTRLLVRSGYWSVVVVVTDYGPARWTKRDIDLSRAAFRRLAGLEIGLLDVSIQRVPR